jgi:Na+/melibiose symporter-like transporter
MTDDYDERTRLMTWRVAILALAILISGGLSPMIRNQLGVTWGYRGVGLFVGALIVVGTLGAWRGTRDIPMDSYGSAGASLRDQLRIVARARDFRTLLTAFVIQALATGAMLAGVDYVARELLGSSGMSTVLFVCFVGPALIVTPLWQRFGESRDKRVGYLAASVLLGLGALGTLGALHSATWLVPLSVAVVGIGYAGGQMFPLAMLADAAAVDAMRTGSNRVGVYTGVWTAAETLGLAFGPFVYAAVLALGGYVSSTTGSATQPGSALTAIGLGFSIVPAVLVALSLVFVVRYRLDEDEVARAREVTA